jgi:excinuclease UvrABC nuclease subunit
VRREDGTMAVTWTAAIQLADQTDAQLAALARRIESDMSRAAAALEFEQAAHLREEAAAARRELQRRLGD